MFNCLDNTGYEIPASHTPFSVNVFFKMSFADGIFRFKVGYL